MSEEEQISPEEKLLKVIQEPAKAVAQKAVSGGDGDGKGQEVGGGDGKAVDRGQESGVSGRDGVSPSAVEGKETPKVEPPKQSKLKLAEPAKSEEVSGGDRGQGAGIRNQEGESIFESAKIGAGMPDIGGRGKIGGMVPVLGEKKIRGGKFGIRMVNKYLIAAAVVVLCCVGWEAGSFQKAVMRIDSMSVGAGSDDAGAEGVVDMAGSGEDLLPLDKVLSDFEKRPIVLDFKTLQSTVQQKNTVVTTTQVVFQSEWQKYAKANLKLMGKSQLPSGGFEAVVSDGKTAKLYFLKDGDKIVLDKQELDVKEVGDRFVNLTDGSSVESVE